ncbi:MAG: protein kinase [Sandaracinaceae bacterium]|nr:protein kinase [Sandaracinaceae bacterium]
MPTTKLASSRAARPASGPSTTTSCAAARLPAPRASLWMVATVDTRAPGGIVAAVELPRRLGPYTLLERLGHGGMAEVFLARAVGASGFEKPVAIKVLKTEHQGDGELERMLIEEAKLGAKLAHRNLVQVHDLGVDGGVCYVRMDYVDGADLDTLRHAGPPSVPLALLVAEEVALALAYVHSLTDSEGRPLGLVHRDVSPRTCSSRGRGR